MYVESSNALIKTSPLTKTLKGEQNAIKSTPWIRFSGKKKIEPFIDSSEDKISHPSWDIIIHPSGDKISHPSKDHISHS